MQPMKIMRLAKESLKFQISVSRLFWSDKLYFAVFNVADGARAEKISAEVFFYHTHAVFDVEFAGFCIVGLAADRLFNFIGNELYKAAAVARKRCANRTAAVVSQYEDEFTAKVRHRVFNASELVFPDNISRDPYDKKLADSAVKYCLGYNCPS